jgi:hypothetical protein
MEKNYIALKTPDGMVIRFRLYKAEAPATCKAFVDVLPIETKAIQARFAGEEIWLPEGPELKIPQENATIALKPGELGYAPPVARSDVSRSIAIVYGEAKLSDCVNVFAMVLDEDMPKLKKLGEKIWLEGARMLRFETISKK